MFVLPVSLWQLPQTWMDGFLSVIPTDKLQMQVGVRPYSKWNYIWPEVGVLAKKTN